MIRKQPPKGLQRSRDVDPSYTSADAKPKDQVRKVQWHTGDPADMLEQQADGSTDDLEQRIKVLEEKIDLLAEHFAQHLLEH